MSDADWKEKAQQVIWSCGCYVPDGNDGCIWLERFTEALQSAYLQGRKDMREEAAGVAEAVEPEVVEANKRLGDDMTIGAKAIADGQISVSRVIASAIRNIETGE